MDNERLGIAEERLDNVVSQIPAMQEDVKKILGEIVEIKLNVAKLPTWDALKEQEAYRKQELTATTLRVTALETLTAQAKASWATIVGICVATSALVGLIVAIVK